jgi:O-antigen/teichoic acid export membrane protein
MTDTKTSAPITGLGRLALWSYVDLVASTLFVLVSTSVLLRQLGAGAFGVVGLVATVAALVATLSNALTLATIRTAAREMATDDDAERADLRAELAVSHALYVATGAVAGLVMAVLALLLPVFIDADLSSASMVVTGLLFACATAIDLGSSSLLGVATGRSLYRALGIAAAVRAAVATAVLLVTVGPLGLPSAGVAQLASVVVGRAVLLGSARLHFHWLRLVPERPTRAALRAAGSSVGPLVMLSVGGQIIATADLVFLGAFVTAASIGLYRLGSLIPTVCVGVLYRAYDVALPSLSATRRVEDQEHATRLLTRVGGFVGGCGLAMLAFARTDIVLVFNGQASDLAADVLLLFAAIWATTVTAHGLGLLIIARGHQRRMMPFVIAEVALNVPLTVILIITVGTRGAAWATLITLGLSHLFFLPILARRELTHNLLRFLVFDAWSPVLIGAVLAGVVFVPFASLSPSLARLSAVVGATVAVALAVGAVLLRASGRREVLTLFRRSSFAAA